MITKKRLVLLSKAKVWQVKRKTLPGFTKNTNLHVKKLMLFLHSIFCVFTCQSMMTSVNPLQLNANEIVSLLSNLCLSAIQCSVGIGRK